MANITCTDCNTTLVRVDRDARVSVAGFICGIVLFFGLCFLLVNVLFGVLVLTIGAIIGMIRKKSKWLMCPNCKKDIVKLS